MPDWGGTAPDLESFSRKLAPSAHKARALRELHALLASADAGVALDRRVAWLERAARWLRAGALPRLAPDEARDEPARSARLRLLVCALETAPGFRAEVSGLVRAVLAETSAFQLFCRLGLPGDRSFLAETGDRLSRRVLPAVHDERDLAPIVARVFAGKKDAAWLAELEPELEARLIAVLGDGGTFTPLARAAADAALLLATRVSALGLSEDVRVRSPERPLRESPLFCLPRACDRLLLAIEREPPVPAEEVKAAYDEVQALFSACRATIAGVIAELEHFGVSVDLVYRLEVMSKNLARLERLIEQLGPATSGAAFGQRARLLSQLVEDRVRDRSILDLARTNLHLLARKIIERAGQTGEHYITATRAEYWKMLASAAGGGVLTAGTAALKFIIGWGHFAPFIEGFLAGSNYALSFLAMQALGFTLATKQPSMTAAALAATLRENSEHAELDALVTMIARITRSQLAAAIGNVGLVIPAAAALDAAYRARFGRHFLDLESAEHVLGSLDPSASGTVPFAALTGVLLWCSSIAAGWVENWAVYRRLPEALAQHRLGRVIGRRAMRWLSDAFARNLSGFGGNVALGFLLGMTPVLGKFFGLPLEVRHVTLSTGALVLAGCALGRDQALAAGAAASALGIGLIGLLNFGVSFVLALLVALRAREVNRSDRLRLVAAIAQRFVQRPMEFFLPPQG